MMDRNYPLLLIVGKSGVGKSAIVDASGLTRVISDTSRDPRPGEEHGREYFFEPRELIEARLADNEYSDFKENYGEYYAARCKEMNNKNVMIIDIHSAIKLRDNNPDRAVIVWINGPQREDRQGRVEPDDYWYKLFHDYCIENHEKRHLDSCVKELYDIFHREVKKSALKRWVMP